jgi:hypothetical protein
MIQRLEQYERNRQRLIYLSALQEDVHKIAVIIIRGMPQQESPGVVAS